MTPDEFRKEFLESVRAVATADADFTASAFMSVAVKHLEDAGEIADFEQCHFRGTGSRRRALAVDGYAFDDVDGSVRLLLAEWKGETRSETLTQSAASTVLGRVRAFVEDAQSGQLHDSIEEAFAAHSLAKELFTRKTSIARFRVYLVTDAVLSSRVLDWPEAHINGIPVDFHIWDMSRFHRVFESKTGQEELEIDFTGYEEEGIPCLAASVESDQYKAYLCVIPGVTLAKLYDQFGSRLLEGNVRSFLSLKGKVNKGIRATILNERRMFFAYNNGIAATASQVDVRPTKAGLRLLTAKDLQIVNGGQTTASLANAMRADKAELSGIFVQMKLSVVPIERSGEVIPLIARYANSQNKVSDADFFSNHEFHRRLEQISRRIFAPATDGAQHETHWFYERARGQYLNEQVKLTRAEKARFIVQNPRNQVVTKTDWAKVENSWRGFPHVVSLGAQKNFISFAEWIGTLWEQSNENFNEEYFRNAIARVILFRTTEDLVSDQPWYQGGYRANIVAYSVAKFAHAIATLPGGMSPDFQAIWNRQALGEAAEHELTIIAKAVFEEITHPPAGFQNVTEWSKKEQLWNKIVDLEIPMSSECRRELVDGAAARERERQARERQVGDNRIGAQIQVVELGRDYWSQALAWARARQLASQDDIRVLSVAVRMPVMVPTERQSATLLELKARLEEEGFRHNSR